MNEQKVGREMWILLYFSVAGREKESVMAVSQLSIIRTHL